MIKFYKTAQPRLSGTPAKWVLI